MSTFLLIILLTVGMWMLKKVPSNGVLRGGEVHMYPEHVLGTTVSPLARGLLRIGIGSVRQVAVFRHSQDCFCSLQE